MKKKTFTTEIAGKALTAEFSNLVERANGSVIIRYGNTIVLGTAVASEKDKPGSDFFPLVVDYEEKFYASGQILGSKYVRREGKPSDGSILSGRVVDRTIRPLFEQHIRREVQVVITVLSIDEDDPDILGVLAASLALGVSDIPWDAPVSAIRIGKMKGSDELVVNPTFKYREHPDLEFDMTACGKDGKINMIEIGSSEISNEMAVKAFELASVEIEKLQEFQKKVIAEMGKKKMVIEKPVVPAELPALFKKEIESKLESTVFSNTSGDKLIEDLRKEWLSLYTEKYPEASEVQAYDHFEEAVNAIVHKEAIEKGRRADGRGLDDIRGLYAEAGGFSPILHGSGIFYRGETHVFSALTLGGPQDAQTIDGAGADEPPKRFMHHYNFPPFSTGEVGRIGNTNRRMIGHGNLAEKSLIPVIPNQELFPYTIRLVSETMTSNGSSSMASVCASSLALMDGGVPISAPVAGIASGLMLGDIKKSMFGSEKYKYALLTDIQGPEDHYGDMDFKVAGTRKGITAIQMDVKIGGIPIPILAEALSKADTARNKLLDVIEKELATPRPNISEHAPKILIIKINPDQIGMVIGPSGKMIKAIKEKTGAEIDIDDDGTVFLTGKNSSAEKARQIIEALTHEYKKGEKFQGTVVKITDFGAFVRIGPNTEGLVHVSEIASFRVDKVETVLKVGDAVPVVIKDVDEKKRLSLSIKQADPNFIKKPQ